MIYRINQDNRFPTPRGNSNRTGVTAADTFDVTAFPADLTNNLITVSKQGVLVVGVEQTVSGGTITISPVVYDSSGPAHTSILTILQPKVFIQPYAFIRNGRYILPCQMQDIIGAQKIGLHVSAITGGGNNFNVQGQIV